MQNRHHSIPMRCSPTSLYGGEAIEISHPGASLELNASTDQLRLMGRSIRAPWQNERHFVAATVEAMRHTLVDRARRNATVKRGGGFRHVDFSDTCAQQDQA